MIHGPLCQLSERELAKSLPCGHSLQITKARLAFKQFAVVPDRAIATRIVHSAQTIAGESPPLVWETRNTSNGAVNEALSSRFTSLVTYVPRGLARAESEGLDLDTF
jgi:hypothetical protein